MQPTTAIRAAANARSRLSAPEDRPQVGSPGYNSYVRRRKLDISLGRTVAPPTRTPTPNTREPLTRRAGQGGMLPQKPLPTPVTSLNPTSSISSLFQDSQAQSPFTVQNQSPFTPPISRRQITGTLMRVHGVSGDFVSRLSPSAQYTLYLRTLNRPH